MTRRVGSSYRARFPALTWIPWLGALVTIGCGDTTFDAGGGGVDPRSRSVQARRYTSNGTSSPADQFQVNTYTTNGQRVPDVAVKNNGAYLVVWESIGSSGDDDGLLSIQGRYYASTGSPLGADFQINSYTELSERAPSVATDRRNSGNFVVVWYRFGEGGGIRGQLYNGGGQPDPFGEFVVNTMTTGYFAYPQVSMNDVGEFAVVWHRADDESSDADVWIRRYDSGGNFIDPLEFMVNDYTTGNQRLASVAVSDNNGFVVTWESDVSPDGDPDIDTSGTSIQAQRYLATTTSPPTRRGPEFQVNTYTLGDQVYPNVAVNSATSAFTVVWGSSIDNQDTSVGSIKGARFLLTNTDDTPVGSEFLVNQYTTGDQIRPIVSAPNALQTNPTVTDFVVTWSSATSPGDDSSLSSVQAQRFNLDADFLGDQFQVNSFTDDYQYWPRVDMNNQSDFVVVWTSYGSDGDDN